MAATRIFITGASGFIGGDFLHILDAAKLPVCITILERSESDAKTIQSKFPDVRIVRGTLDDASLLEQESAAADIVVNLASAQHFPSVQAIHRGLSQQQRASPPYLLQISGATLLSASEVAQKRFGQASDVVVNDWDDIARVRAIIRASPNRRIDNFVLDVADREPKVLTALLGGPIIYGQGRGLVNQRSGQLPELARIALQRGKAMYIGEGRNRWSGVHIHDFSDLLLRLTKKTIERDQDTNIWGANGVYLPGTHEAPVSTVEYRGDGALIHGIRHSRNSHVRFNVS